MHKTPHESLLSILMIFNSVLGLYIYLREEHNEFELDYPRIHITRYNHNKKETREKCGIWTRLSSYPYNNI